MLNLSYGMYATTGYNVDQLLWSQQEASIISYENGQAVISAAGNDSVALALEILMVLRIILPPH